MSETTKRVSVKPRAGERLLDGWTFHVLLGVLSIGHVLSPILTQSETTLPLQRRLTALVLVTGLIILRRRHRDLIFGTLLVLPALVTDVMTDELASPTYIVGTVSATLYLLFLASLIAQRIFRARVVTLGTISAALCLYLVVANAWGAVYDLVEVLEDVQSFAGIQPAGEVHGLLARQQREMDLDYFSMVTITTLGYGDITPASGLTRGLASLEAFFGQMFLAVLVARLVSLYSMQSANREP